VLEQALFFQLGLVFLFEKVFAFFESALLLALFVLGFFKITGGFLAPAEQLVFGFEFRFLEDVVGVFFSLADDLAGASLGGEIVNLILLAEKEETRPAAADQARNEAQDGTEGIVHVS